MIKNKIAVLTQINKNLELISDVKIPSLKKGQVLVEIIFSAVCGSQLYEIKGLRDTVKYIPHTLGHEATGRVIDKYKNVKKVNVNDKVFISWILSSGKDSLPPKYFYPNSNKIINCGKVATFSKFSIVPENRVNLIPKKLNLRNSVLLGCAIPTGAGMVINQAKIKSKNKVLVIGAGGVGMSCLMALNLKKNIMVDVYDININSHKIIKKFFPKFNCLNKKKYENIKKKIKQDYNLQYDYLFETSGNINSLENSIYLIKNSGKVIFASHPAKKLYLKIDPFELIKGKKIEGSWGGNTNFNKNLKDFTQIILKNSKLVNYITSKYFSFNLINKGIQLMKDKKILRPIIKIKNF